MLYVGFYVVLACGGFWNQSAALPHETTPGAATTMLSCSRRRAEKTGGPTTLQPNEAYLELGTRDCKEERADLRFRMLTSGKIQPLVSN